jgi:hypothetical protein
MGIGVVASVMRVAGMMYSIRSACRIGLAMGLALASVSLPACAPEPVRPMPVRLEDYSFDLQPEPETLVDQSFDKVMSYMESGRQMRSCSDAVDFYRRGDALDRELMQDFLDNPRDPRARNWRRETFLPHIIDGQIIALSHAQRIGCGVQAQSLTLRRSASTRFVELTAAAEIQRRPAAEPVGLGPARSRPSPADMSVVRGLGQVFG